MKNSLNKAKVIIITIIGIIAVVLISSLAGVNLDLIDSDMHTQFTQCESIYGHSIIEKNSLYYVISDAICENYKISYEPLDGDLSPIEITDGSFFLNIKKIRKIFFKAGTFPSSEISSVSC